MHALCEMLSKTLTKEIKNHMQVMDAFNLKRVFPKLL